MTQTQPFGSRAWNLDVMVEGSFTLSEFLEGLEQVVNVLGMDRAGMEPDVRSYPIPDGRGGEGKTIMQPYVELKLLHQPLTTSFVIIDSWPEHFTLTIKSCVQFDPVTIMQEIPRIFGNILDCHYWVLGRNNRQHRAWCGGGGG